MTLILDLAGQERLNNRERRVNWGNRRHFQRRTDLAVGQIQVLSEEAPGDRLRLSAHCLSSRSGPRERFEAHDCGPLRCLRARTLSRENHPLETLTRFRTLPPSLSLAAVLVVVSSGNAADVSRSLRCRLRFAKRAAARYRRFKRHTVTSRSGEVPGRWSEDCRSWREDLFSRRCPIRDDRSRSGYGHSRLDGPPGQDPSSYA